MMRNIITVLSILFYSFIYAQDVTLSLDDGSLNYDTATDFYGFQWATPYRFLKILTDF